MYASIRKFAIRGFIAMNILAVVLAVLGAVNIVPNEIPRVEWIKADNPEAVMWILLSPFIFIYALFVLVMGFELSQRAGHPLALVMVQKMGIQSGMLLFYLAIWITIGWWMWKIPGSDLISEPILNFSHSRLQEGSLMREVLSILGSYMVVVDAVLYAFCALFPIVGGVWTLAYMYGYREIDGGEFNDIIDDPDNYTNLK